MSEWWLYLGIQPDVAGGETTSFPSTTSALIDDAPQVQGVRWRPAPVACADLSASRPTSARSRQTPKRSRWPQSLTARGCRAATRSAIGHVAHLRTRNVLSSA